MNILPTIELKEIRITYDERLRQLRIVKPEEILLFLDETDAAQLRDFLNENA